MSRGITERSSELRKQLCAIAWELENSGKIDKLKILNPQGEMPRFLQSFLTWQEALLDPNRTGSPFTDQSGIQWAYSGICTSARLPLDKEHELYKDAVSILGEGLETSLGLSNTRELNC